MRGIPAFICAVLLLSGCYHQSKQYTHMLSGRNFSAVVTSTPEPDFNTFVNQRLRWVFEVADLSFIGKLTLGMEIGMLAAFAASLAIARWEPQPAMLLALSWFMGYALMLRSSQGYRPGDMRWIPAVLLFQPVYSAVLGWRKLFGGKKITWKGRTFNGPQ